MKAKNFSLLTMTIIFSCIIKLSFGQMETVINIAQSKLTKIESNDHMVEKTLYDFLIKDNNSTFGYEYYFYSGNAYTVTAMGEPEKLRNIKIKILKKVDSEWKLLKETFLQGIDLSLQFAPDESKRYKIQIECTYIASYTESCFGLIIDREI